MKVSDLTENELRTLIGDVIDEKLREFSDPDYGLQLRDDFVYDLETSLSSKERIPFEKVKKTLGLI
ncbi:MAG: hypothetical protein HQK92_04345 [Nitrospirae bacterium]|nr:hypothetical protein [Nitrospirota bacterium]